MVIYITKNEYRKMNKEEKRAIKKMPHISAKEHSLFRGQKLINDPILKGALSFKELLKSRKT